MAASVHCTHYELYVTKNAMLHKPNTDCREGRTHFKGGGRGEGCSVGCNPQPHSWIPLNPTHGTGSDVETQNLRCTHTNDGLFRRYLCSIFTYSKVTCDVVQDCATEEEMVLPRSRANDLWLCSKSVPHLSFNANLIT